MENEVVNKIKEILKSDKKLTLLVASLSVQQIPLLELRCKLQKDFYQAREKLRVPKDKELTDFDRTIMDNAYCAEIQEQYEYVKGLEEIVKEHIKTLRLLIGVYEDI